MSRISEWDKLLEEETEKLLKQTRRVTFLQFRKIERITLETLIQNRKVKC